MTFPDVGDLAPDFTLPAHDGSSWSLSAQRGSRVIVYFYPAAFTPGCTTEACEFRDSFGALEADGWQVVGISQDAPARNAEFVADQHLDFPLLSDEDHAVHEAYSTWGERERNGSVTIGPIRSTFAIDADGSVVLAWRNVDPVGQVLRLTEALAG
jgi:peroxiredoxin Q/BCP